MKYTRILSVLLVLIFVCSMMIAPASATEVDLQLQCGNAVLIDAELGEVLYGQNAYDQAFPASTTKVMTALLTLEAMEAGTISPDTMVTVSEFAAHKDFVDESTANLQAGEQMSVKDLLYCLMLPSANDAAKALGEFLGGTTEEFAKMMNDRAAALGCVDTHFVNANGLHDPNHYTTAYDLALMFRAAMEHDLFLQIIATADYTTAPTNLSAERYFYNTNGLISNYYYSGHVYEKCIGGKTGYTSQAGRCLVAAAKDGDRVLISVVMGAGPITLADGTERLGQFDESKRLLEYGFTNFRRVNLTLPPEPVASVGVSLSEDGDTVGLIPQGSIPRMLPNSIPESDIQTQVTLLEDTVQAPVEEGQVMGAVRFYYEEQELGQLDLVAEKSLSFSKKLERRQNRQAFWAANGGWIITVLVVILLLPAAALIALRYINIYRRKRRRKRRKAAGRYAANGHRPKT